MCLLLLLLLKLPAGIIRHMQTQSAGPATAFSGPAAVLLPEGRLGDAFVEVGLAGWIHGRV